MSSVPVRKLSSVTNNRSASHESMRKTATSAAFGFCHHFFCFFCGVFCDLHPFRLCKCRCSMTHKNCDMGRSPVNNVKWGLAGLERGDSLRTVLLLGSPWQNVVGILKLSQDTSMSLTPHPLPTFERLALLAILGSERTKGTTPRIRRFIRYLPPIHFAGTPCKVTQPTPTDGSW